MSPAAPEATNRASTAPRRGGVARLAGRGGEVATATGRTPRRSMQTRRRLPDGAPTRQAAVHSLGESGVARRRLTVRNRSAAGGVTTSRHRHGRVGMQLRRAAVGVALVATVVAAGCSGGGDGAGGGGGEGQVAPAADAASARDEAAPAGKAGPTEAAAQVRLVDLGNRIVRTATIDLEVGKGGLNDTVN